MGSTVRSSLPSPLRKSLRIGSEGLKARGEVDPQELRIDEHRREIGACIDGSLDASGYTNDSAARDMGYGDNQTSLRRWTEGSENAQLARLRELNIAFRREFIKRLAKAWQIGVVVETTLRFHDTAVNE